MTFAKKNYLRLEGNEQEINRFIQKANGGTTNFNNDDPLNLPIFLCNFIPIPMEILDADGGVDNSSEESGEFIFRYGFNWQDDWCMANWGTVQDVGWATYDEKQHLYVFGSGCYAPLVAICKISYIFPNITFYFKYENEGKMSNEYVIKNGDILPKVAIFD